MQEVKRGDRVSLNLSKRQYFFQDGEGGINLSETVKEMDIIPENATDHHLAQINHAIRAGGLVRGYAETRVEGVTDDDSDVKGVALLGRGKIDEWLTAFMSDKSIPQAKKSSKLEALLAAEKAGKNRVGVCTIVEKQLRYIGGISRIEEGEQEKLVIKVTSGNEEVVEQQ